MPIAQDPIGQPIGTCWTQYGVGQSVAYTGTAGVITNPVSADTRFVRVMCTTTAFIAFGSAPTALVTDIPVAANVPEVFPIIPGHKVSAIQAAAGGTLYVKELLN